MGLKAIGERKSNSEEMSPNMRENKKKEIQK
jgi:hypothetical protein